jgi:hypothetical protein
MDPIMGLNNILKVLLTFQAKVMSLQCVFVYLLAQAIIIYIKFFGNFQQHFYNLFRQWQKNDKFVLSPILWLLGISVTIFREKLSSQIQATREYIDDCRFWTHLQTNLHKKSFITQLLI